MNVAQIISVLGGPAAVGRQLGIRSQAVSLWIAKGRIPIQRVPDLLRMADRLHLQLKAAALRPDVDWDAVR
jgi:DNA-binding transcriptional regulator YdaS (Cro superfamily)